MYKKDPPNTVINRAKIISSTRIPVVSSSKNKNTSDVVIKIATHIGMLLGKKILFLISVIILNLT